MEPIAKPDIRARIERDNPWWFDTRSQIPEAAFQRRVYFAPFKSLALNFGVRRATILLGPRRVGKTVIIKQLALYCYMVGRNITSRLEDFPEQIATE